MEYTVYKKKLEPVPAPAEPLKAPEEMKSTEELYLAGTHLEQYRHATSEPADYYLEGLKRDSTDIRLNNSYGLLLYKGGRMKDSISISVPPSKNKRGKIRIPIRENAGLTWGWP